jgi:hypothetical protein
MRTNDGHQPGRASQLLARGALRWVARKAHWSIQRQLFSVIYTLVCNCTTARCREYALEPTQFTAACSGEWYSYQSQLCQTES